MQSSVIYFVILISVFLIVSSGIVWRRSLSEIYQSRKRALVKFYSTKSHFDDYQRQALERISRLRLREINDEISLELKDLEDELTAEAGRLEHVRKEFAQFRFLRLSFKSLFTSVKRRLSSDIDGILENPVGLAAVVIGASIYSGIAFAGKVHSATPYAVDLNSRTFCGILLISTEDVFVFRAPPDSSNLVVVPRVSVSSLSTLSYC